MTVNGNFIDYRKPLNWTGSICLTTSKHVGQGYVSLLTNDLDQGIASCLSSLASKKQLYFILVDDFLDPELLQGNLLDPLQPTILVKPYGLYPSISPIFSNEQACYYCFSERLLANQPIRKWWLLNKQEQLFIPVEKGGGQNSLSLFDHLGTVDPTVLTIFNQEYLKLSEHKIKHDPECTYCGQPDLYMGQVSYPLQIESQKKNDYRDGGFRTEKPEHTLKKLLSLVDPVTGHICNSYLNEPVEDASRLSDY